MRFRNEREFLQSESIIDELIEVEVSLLVAQTLKLSCQLVDLIISDAHLSKDLLDAV